MDESHVATGQLHGMYLGDRSRKQTLVDYGFRLPAALDNRPLQFEEFEARVKQLVFVSATPGDYELGQSGGRGGGAGGAAHRAGGPAGGGAPGGRPRWTTCWRRSARSRPGASGCW